MIGVGVILCSKVFVTPNDFCNKECTITMVTNQSEVEFYINGFGKKEVIIDWGDGSENEMITLHNSLPHTFVKHYYSESQIYTVKIISENTITYFDCSDNLLTDLDVSENTALTGLVCYNNQLTILNVSNNTALTQLYCSYNQLENLDLSNNTALTSFHCDNNLQSGE